MAEEKLHPKPIWLWTVISFAIPAVGILLGIIYKNKDAPESKSFGGKALIAGILGVASCLTLYLVWLFALGAADIIG